MIMKHKTIFAMACASLAAGALMLFGQQQPTGADITGVLTGG